MRWLFRTSDRLVAGLALLGTLGILAMMLHVTADVILRSTLSISVPATIELVTRYYMITLVLLPLGWVEWKQQMVTVEAFSGVFGEAGIRWLDTLVALLAAGFYALFTLATWEKAAEQFDLGAYVMALDLAVPVWPTYFVLPLSFALACLVCLIRILRLHHPLATDQDGNETGERHVD